MKPFALFLMATLAASSVHATLILNINNYTSNELSFTISGIFNADTTGDDPGWIGIKNDWTNNYGVHTELFNEEPTITLNTIQIGGVTPSITLVDNDVGEWDDGVYWTNPSGSSNPFTAGTSVSGSMTLYGEGNFDPTNFPTLELVSGFDSSVNDYTRLESRGGPEPSTLILSLVGLMALATGRWNR